MKLYFAASLLFQWIFAFLTADKNKQAYYSFLWETYFGDSGESSQSQSRHDRKKTIHPASEEPRPLLIER
jgi:hypothetical protein